MTTITAKFRGNTENLKMFFVCGVKHASKKTIYQNSAEVVFICEEPNKEQAMQDVMDSINMREADMWGVEVKSIF